MPWIDQIIEIFPYDLQSYTSNIAATDYLQSCGTVLRSIGSGSDHRDKKIFSFFGQFYKKNLSRKII